jgi:hypothetical protein
MDVAALLLDAESDIVDDSFAQLQHSHVTHYESAGEELTRQRLDELFRLVVSAIRDRDLSAVAGYATKIATERFEQGFDIGEVQAAFNALEQAIWRRVVAGTPPADLAEATGLVGTVLGHGKDVLARTYVSLASQRHVRSLDLSALFS